VHLVDDGLRMLLGADTTPDQGCVVGHGIQPAMQSIYKGIEETLRHELARVTLENVLRDVLAAPR
jgi:hypothetical protein